MNRSPSAVLVPAISPLQLAGNSPLKPLRMAVDLSWLRPGGEAGGVKPFIFEYLRELSALEGDRLVIIYLTWSCSHAEIRSLARPQDELVCVRHTESADLVGQGAWLAGERFLPAPPADLLLQLEADLHYIPLGMPQFACPGIPNISTIVDVLHRDFPSSLTAAMIAHRETLFAFLIKITDRFQCISQFTANRLNKHFGIPLERTFCSYIPIHRRLKSETDRAQRPRLSAPYFFYPANFWKHKNHESLLVAYRHYRHHCSGSAWDLVLTGYEDESMRQVRSVAAHLDLKENVHFFGHLPDHEFTEVWQQAGALVFPSLHEGFGIPLLEAMHFGIPILCNSEGSLGEVAGRAALIADARDPVSWASAMKRIATDQCLRAELISLGYERLAQFSLRDEVAEFRDIIRSVSSKPSLQLWQKGIHPDGWMEKTAILCLPKSDGPLRLSLRIGPNPVPRHLIIKMGLTIGGAYEIPAWVEKIIELTVESQHRSLVLEVPDAENFDPGDHRQHGVVVDTVSATDATNQTYGLFEAN